MIIMLLTFSMLASAQDNTGKNYVRNGNVFVQVVKKGANGRKSTPARKTGMTWKDSKGKTYDIMMSSRGSCFVNKTNAEGKEYKHYLGAEISQEICKSLKVEYKGKTK